MCVILTAEGRSRIAERTMIEANDRNRDGIGMAWLDRGFVRWRKGLTLRDAIDLASDVPLPYVAHFRIATVGAPSAALCHPFPILRHARGTETGGRSREVLFHNGHWSGWEGVLNKAIGAHTRVKEPWSDSRAMAIVATFCGAEKVAHEVAKHGQRIVLLSAAAGVRRFGQTWTEIDRGIFASNTFGLTVRTSETRNGRLSWTPTLRFG
jgi:hypothetical protein